MKLAVYYPVKPVFVNQPFGNVTPVYTAEGLKGHNGIDFAAKHGEPVYATHDGYASFQIDNSGGEGVVIITKDQFDYNGGSSYFKTIYWHFCDSHKEPNFTSPFADKTGFTPVKAGDLIGYADTTGQSTGDHLHFGLKPVDKGEDWGTWYSTETNNGYMGAIDPAPYFNGLFAQDIIPTAFQFYRNLTLGSHGEDVLALQKYLNTHGSVLATSGPGSSGNETTYFGPITQKALASFQSAHSILPASGYFGPITRAYIT